MSALREILAAFSVEVEDDELQKASHHIEGFVGKLQAVVPVMAEAFAVGALTEFVSETVEAGAHVFDLANKLGVGTEELQQFQFAAKLAGVESESAAHSLGFLNKAVGEAVTGSAEAQQTFAKLHVPLKDVNGKTRETGDILMDVSDALAGLPDQQTRAAYAMKLFGREGQALLPVLSQGSAHLQEVNAEFAKLGGGMSDEFVRQSKETQDELDKLKFGLESIKVRIVAALLPAANVLIAKLKDLIGPVIEWLEHTHGLEHGLQLLAAVMGGKMISSAIKLLRVMGLLKSTTKGTLLAFAEFAVPIALIGALYLMFDDLMTLMEGGDSEIGAFLEELGGVEGKDEFVKELRDAWNDLKVSLGDVDWAEVIEVSIKAIVGTMYELIEGAKLLVHVLKYVGEGAGDLVSGAVGLITGNKGLVDAATDPKTSHASQTGAAIGNDWDAMMNPSEHWKKHPAATPPEGVDVDKDRASWKAAMAARDARKAKELTSQPEANASYAPPTVTPAGNSGPSTQVGQINVTVQAGKNPEDTGKRVAQSAATELERQNRDAHANLKRM